MTQRVELFLELEQTFRHFFRQYRSELSQIIGDQLTGTEYSILHHLSTKSPQIVTELSQEFHVSVSHITHVADQLENKHLAYRKRSTIDKRVVEIHITENGNELVTQISKKKQAFISEKFAQLSTEELHQLLHTFQKLI